MAVDELFELLGHALSRPEDKAALLGPAGQPERGSVGAGDGDGLFGQRRNHLMSKPVGRAGIAASHGR